MTTPDPDHAQDRRPQNNFGPHVIAIARFLANTEVAPEDTVAFLIEVNRRWPGLSFRDFMGAAVLAEALAMKTVRMA
jgi:hypothetical protein